MTQTADSFAGARPRPVGVAARPRLQLVPPPALGPPRAPFVALVVALLGGGLVTLLLLNTAIAANSFRMHELQQRTAALNLQEQQLQREIDDKAAPGALAAQARKLGMIPAGAPAFISLPDGRILGSPAPAKAPPPPPAPRPSPSVAASAAPAASATPAPVAHATASPVVRR